MAEIVVNIMKEGRIKAPCGCTARLVDMLTPSVREAFIGHVLNGTPCDPIIAFAAGPPPVPAHHKGGYGVTECLGRDMDCGRPLPCPDHPLCEGCADLGNLWCPAPEDCLREPRDYGVAP